MQKKYIYIYIYKITIDFYLSEIKSYYYKKYIPYI